MKQVQTKYLESQVLTASPERLVVILYDGAARFCVQAQEAIRQKRGAEAGELLIRAQRVVMELLCALNAEAAPEIARNLASLYSFMYEQLVWANVEQSEERIETVVKLLGTLREGWAGAIERRKAEGEAG